jgi:hypothetical protein
MFRLCPVQVTWSQCGQREKKKNLASTDQDFVLLPMGWSPNANSIIPISDKADFKLKSEDKEDHFISIKGTIR